MIAWTVFDMAEVDGDAANRSLIDPMERRRLAAIDSDRAAYTGPSRVHLPQPYMPPRKASTEDQVIVDLRAIRAAEVRAKEQADRLAREVPVERARLAATDPAGERGAVVPLSEFRARQLLLEDAERTAIATKRSRIPAAPGRRDLESGRELLTRLGAPAGSTSGRIPCPAHGGEDPNLAWRLTPSGTALLKCWSHGCTFAEIVKALR